MGIALIILILVIAGYYFYVNRAVKSESPYTCLLSGFWRAPKTYLIESETELISLYVESNLQDAWIIIKKEDGFILNDPVEINLKEIEHTQKTIKYEVYFTGIESDDFPNKQYMLYYPECCKIILYSGNRIYAILYKDCELTETAMEEHFNIKVDEASLDEPELVDEEDMGESLQKDTEDL